MTMIDRIIPVMQTELGTMAQCDLGDAMDALVSLQRRRAWDNSIGRVKSNDEGNRSFNRAFPGWASKRFFLQVAGSFQVVESIVEPDWVIRCYKLRWQLTAEKPFVRISLLAEIDWGPKLLRRYTNAISVASWSRRLELLKMNCEEVENG